mgnify:FL=1
MRLFVIIMVVATTIIYIHFRFTQYISAIVFKNEESGLSVISNLILVFLMIISWILYLYYNF